MIGGTAIETSASCRRRALVALLLIVPAPSIAVLTAAWWAPGAMGRAVWFASKAWLLVLPVVWELLWGGGRLSLSPVRRGGLLLGVGSGLLLSGAIVVGIACAQGLVDREFLRGAVERIGITGPGVYIALALALSLGNALMEEYVWRWFVYTRCTALVGARGAIGMSALLFTVHHVFALGAQVGVAATAAGSAGVFVGGVVWALLYRRTGSIWPGFISHVLADLAVFGAGYVLLFGAPAG